MRDGRKHKYELAYRVKSSREKLGVSALELDRRSGLVPGHVSKIESGYVSSPGIRVISVIAIALCVDIGWLATGKQ